MKTFKYVQFSLALLITFFAMGCQTPPKENPALVARMENVKSILIVPAINESVKVDAPDFLLTTISVPLAELGYYVFPINLTKRILEDSGLADADLVHSASPQKLGELFGADTILYMNIKQWNAKYVVVQTNVTVQIEYQLKDVKTGETLWEHTQLAQIRSGGDSLAAMLVESLMYKAMEEQHSIDAATQTHLLAFSYFSGKPNYCNIILLDEKNIHKLPQTVKDIIRVYEGKKYINVNEWSVKYVNVLCYPEKRVYLYLQDHIETFTGQNSTYLLYYKK